MNFLKDKNEEKMAELHSEDEIQKAKEENEKLNATLGFNLQRNQIYNGFLRGKSVNYNQRSNPFGNTMGYTGSKISGQNRLSSVASRNTQQQPKLTQSGVNRPSTLSQLNNQFLTFKL